MILRGVDFDGPLQLKQVVSESPGLYLVCTESSGGFRVIGVYVADNIRDSVMNNPWAEKWKDFEDEGIFFYVHESDSDDLNERCRDIIDTRCYEVPCVDSIKDDW